MRNGVHKKTSVFATFGMLALKHDSINLAQGMPSFDAPPLLVEAAAQAMRDGHNQYAPPSGVAPLRTAIAEHAMRFYRMSIDPDTMVTVTAGATAGIFSTVAAFVEAGDEVVAFDPSYEAYRAAVEVVGGVFRTVPLHPPDSDHDTWWFSPDELAAVLGARTKLLLLNTPHNPTGKVFTADELATIAELTAPYPMFIVADEVYEHLAYAPAKHVRLASLPGMAQRTITISSASKTFSVTGWRIGWVISHPDIHKYIRYAHQSFIYSAPSAEQHAVAQGLRQDNAYYDTLNADYIARRDALARSLVNAGMTPVASEGTYFTMLDIRARGFADDVAFCTEVTTEVRVTPLPCSPFFDLSNRDRTRYARFTFCRDLDALGAAGVRLARFRAAR